MKRIFGPGRYRGLYALVLALAAMTVVFWPSFASGSASGLTSSSSTFVNSNHVNFTLEGCRNNGTITLPINGKFVCADGAYTTGNLGKGWNELDLVPHRLISSSGSQTGVTTDYNVVVAADNCNYTTTDNGFKCEDNNVGSPGYDVISVPAVNTSESDASCSVSAGPQLYQTSFGGGTDIATYRVLTIHQSANTTCVFDYYQRLALGAHLFPGSSLQSYMFEDSGFSIGKRTISIPVNEIKPQSLSKDMSATQNTDHTWNVTKNPSPDTLSFGNTCDPTTPRNLGLSVTVSWTKSAATPSGDITVVTHVYATNPAARTITTTVSDVIYSGTTALDTVGPATADVPANTTNFLMLTHSINVPSGTTNLNDIATGTYVDTVTGVAIPGSTTATASATVQPSGINLNNSAVINDIESISGAHLSFSTDSFSGATGAFDGGYVAGTATTSPVSWTSATQSGSGSVTFSKTVYVNSADTTSGALADTATLTGSDGFTTQASASVSIDTHPLVSLTITKTINAPVGSDQTFYFDVAGKSPSTHDAVTVKAGTTSGSTTLTGLEPDTYTVTEETPGSPWTAVSGQQQANLTSSCTGGVSFSNTFNPAIARVQKVTAPAGFEAGWAFTLTGSDGSSGTATTDSSGGGTFSTVSLQDGVTYTMTETPQTGWDLTAVSGQRVQNSTTTPLSTTATSCSFTVHYPADADAVFQCAFTNTERGHIIVKKYTNPSGSPQLFTFTPSYNGGTTFQLSDTQSNDSGPIKPNTYSVSETVPAGWNQTSATCDNGDAPAAIHLGAGQTITCTFRNTQRGKLTVLKTVNGGPLASGQSFTFQVRQGATPTQSGSILESKVISSTTFVGLANGAVFDNGGNLYVPGPYQLCEIVMPGWQTTLGSFVPNSFLPPDGVAANPAVDNSILCINITIAANGNQTFTVDNTPPPGGRSLTIGFWKNWASCASSNGKQKPVLDNTLAAAVAATTNPPGGLVVSAQNIGGGWPNYAPTYYLVLGANDCTKAVSLLNKQNWSNGKKMSSDPLFNMTAQLVAAQLNYFAGSAKSGTTTTNVNRAVVLNGKYQFNGGTAGNGQGYVGKLSSADTSTANCLATQLDNYNNDRPVSSCP